MTKSGRYAAIDIGTVTCRLLVADVLDDASIREVRRETVICNLGKGVDETGRLEAASIERVGTAIEGFVKVMGELGSSATGEGESAGAAGVPGNVPEAGSTSQPSSPFPVKVVATSASRDAENADEFRARLAQAGLELNIVPGEREAALSFAGASSAFAGERVVVLDIGGGSTEIIAGQAGAEPDRARSFNVGCRRVTERFFHNDPPSARDLDEARTWIDAEFTPYLDELRSASLLDGRVVAVAGTATSVVSMREQMAVYDSSRVHKATVNRADVDELLDRLSRMTCDERRVIVGLDPGRAPVIVAGLLILERIMELAEVDTFTVSECDILHGIILDAAK